MLEAWQRQRPVCEGAASPITRRAIPTPEFRVSVVLPAEEQIQVIRNKRPKKSNKNIKCIHSYFTATSNFFNSLVRNGRNIFLYVLYYNDVIYVLCPQSHSLMFSCITLASIINFPFVHPTEIPVMSIFGPGEVWCGVSSSSALNRGRSSLTYCNTLS